MVVIETFERGMSGSRRPTVKRQTAEIACPKNAGVAPTEIAERSDIGVASVYRRKRCGAGTLRHGAAVWWR